MGAPVAAITRMALLCTSANSLRLMAWCRCVRADLQTMERRLQSRCYSDLDGFVADMQLIFDNCRLYNQENTPYYKCANTLERDFQTMLKELPRP